MVWQLIPMIAQAGQQAYQGHAGAKAIDRATASEMRMGQLGLEQQRKQFDMMNELLQPFYQSGAAQLPFLQQGAMQQDFSQLRNQSPIQQLIGQRVQDTRSALSTPGLTRSGYGLKQMGSAESDALSEIEQLLTGRRQSLAGQAQTTGANLASLGNTNVNAITGLLGGMGDAQARGIIGNQQLRSATMSNLADLGAAAYDYYR
jgi:hypothetical protein